MLADMATQIEAARAARLHRGAGGRRGRQEPLASSRRCASCSRPTSAMKVTTDAVQLFGGYGYCKDYPDREVHAGRQDHADLRGHEPDPAPGHRPEPCSGRRLPAAPRPRRRPWRPRPRQTGAGVVTPRQPDARETDTRPAPPEHGSAKTVQGVALEPDASLASALLFLQDAHDLLLVSVEPPPGLMVMPPPRARRRSSFFMTPASDLPAHLVDAALSLAGLRQPRGRVPINGPQHGADRSPRLGHRRRLRGPRLPARGPRRLPPEPMPWWSTATWGGRPVPTAAPACARGGTGCSTSTPPARRRACWGRCCSCAGQACGAICRGEGARTYARCLAWHDLFWAACGVLRGACAARSRLGLAAGATLRPRVAAERGRGAFRSPPPGSAAAFSLRTVAILARCSTPS